MTTSEYKSKFQEIRSLGCGGFSSVFEVKSLKDGNKYAIKKIAFKAEESDKTLKEIIFFGELESDFVVRYVHSWVESNYYNEPKCDNSNQLFDPEKPYLLHIQMELCSMTLQQFIVNTKCLNKNLMNTNYYYIACKIFIQLLECVQYLHSHNPQIIHRDLKPQNILLTNGDNNRCVKLADFGLSTFHEFIDQSHTSGRGTAFYKAPEIINNKYTIKADIYSIGMIMKDLFNFDFTRESVKNSEIQQKYNKLKKICLSCLSQFPNKRPNCDEILKKKNWIFNQNIYENLFMSTTRLTKINLCYESVFKFNFEKWPLIKNIDLEFLKNCKYMSVTETIERKAILLTNDKKVYGYHIDRPLEQPIIIKEFMNKQIKSIVCGKYHVLCLTEDMIVYSFGDNTFGQLGNGTYLSNNKPTIIQELKDKRIIDVKCGGHHSLALSESGEVYLWGHGGCGLIENGKNNNMNSPVLINSLISEKIILIACGFFNCLSLSESGTLYGWGGNENGQLGTGNYDQQTIPTVIRFDDRITIKKISCALNHSLVLTSDNDIFSFGYGYNNNKSSRRQNIPIKIQTNIKFIDIETNIFDYLSVGLSIDNKFYVWGQCYNEWINSPKQTNFNSFVETFIISSQTYIPYNITKDLLITEKSEFLKIFKKIESFNYLDQYIIANIKSFSLVRVKESEGIFVTNDLIAYTFRLNESIDIPNKEPILVNKRIKTITSGFEHVLFLTENKEVYAFGDNYYGQLGNGCVKDNYLQTIITDLSDKEIVEISCGAHHSIALSKFGELFVWGSGLFGQIGNNKRESSFRPIEILFPNSIRIISINCGADHCLALSSNGEIYVWGKNNCGQLGIGNNDNQCKPYLYQNSSKIIITKICCGFNHSLLLTSDFIIYSSGDNTFGQLGKGELSDSNEFLKIESSVKFIDIHTNWCDNFSAGLSHTGNYYVWGICGDKVITTPKQTDLKSFDEIFAQFSIYKFTYKSIILNKVNDILT